LLVVRRGECSLSFWLSILSPEGRHSVVEGILDELGRLDEGLDSGKLFNPSTKVLKVLIAIQNGRLQHFVFIQHLVHEEVDVSDPVSGEPWTTSKKL
jgi:hypothetical protein